MECSAQPTSLHKDSAPLLLNFDINKTLIISDVGAGVDSSSMINSILSECSWGKINFASLDFELLSEAPSSSPPGKVVEDLSEAALRPKGNEPYSAWLTYNEFLEDVKQVAYKLKKTLKKTFTCPGQVGEKFREFYVKFEEALKLPPEVLKDNPIDRLPEVLQSGSHFILPSFFRLLIHLQETGREFHLVFRTFGEDIPKIAGEFNAFCEGAHPLYPGVAMDGSAAGPDRRLLLPLHSGCFYRDGPGSEGVHLTLVNPTHQVLELHHGLQNVSRVIQERARTSTLALRDHYPWWRAQGESDQSGKVLVVGQGPTPASPTPPSPPAAGSEAWRTVFFDDNVERRRAHIVDVRDQNGDPVPFELSRDRYIVKVEPYDAVLDHEYFINLLKKCEHQPVHVN